MATDDPASAGKDGDHDAYASLRHRDFRLFIGSGLLKNCAQQIQSVAVGWEVYHRTGSAMNLGMTALVAAIPTLCLSLVAGHVADRFSRKSVMLVSWTISALAAIALAALSYYGNNWPGWLWMVYATLAINSTAMTFARPARQSFLPRIVPGAAFTNAVTWSNSTQQMSSMLGPAIGGLVLAISLPLAYALAGAISLLAVWQVWRIAFVHQPLIAATSDRRLLDLWHNLTAGVRFVWGSPLLLSAMTLDMLAVLFGGATQLLPIFAQRLGLGPVGFGSLRASQAVGACLMAILLAHRRPMQRAGRALLLAVAGFGVATIVFGLSRSYALSLAMLGLIGALDTISVVIRHSLIQLLPGDHMRGRVSAVNQIFVGSSDQLGGVESGLTAAAFGPVISVVGGGIATILVVFGVALHWPDLWRLGRLQDAKPEPPADAPAAPAKLVIAA